MATPKKPKELSIDEAREEFIGSLVQNALHGITTKSVTKKQAVVNSVFGLLTLLEGSGDFPFCIVTPKGGLSRDGTKLFPSQGELLRGEDHHMFLKKLAESYREKTGKELFPPKTSRVARKRRSK